MSKRSTEMLNESFEKFSGYVLAGGKSSRMGADKAFLKFGNETFLNNAVKNLETVCGKRVGVILNQLQTDFIEKIPPQTQLIFDTYKNRGAPGGIHAALKNCASEWAIILACDLPFVTSEAVAALCGIALESDENICAVIPQQFDGKLQPLCGIYRPQLCLAKLENLLQTRSSPSARDFLKLILVNLVDATAILRDTGSLFLNVNTQEDYKNAK